MKKYFKIAPDKIEEKELVFLITGFVILVFIGFLGIRYLTYQKARIEELKTGNIYETVVCEVVGYKLKFNSNVFDYQIKGIDYQYFYQNTEPLHIGEKYIGKYKSDDPDIIVVELTKPVIDSSEFEETICTIVTVDLTKDKNFVHCYYYVNDRKIKRIDYVENASAFCVGKNYPIIYKKENPKISYLLNDRKL